MFEAKIWREVQTELRQFDGNFCLQASFSDALQNLEIVFLNQLRLGAVLDVFAQVCEDRSDLLASQRLRRAKCVIQRFAGHKPGHCAAHKGITCGVVAKPSILRRSQQQGSHQTHSFVSSFFAADSTFLPVRHSELNRCQESAEFCPLSARIRKSRARATANQPARHRREVQSWESAHSPNPSRLSRQSEESRARCAARGLVPD